VYTATTGRGFVMGKALGYHIVISGYGLWLPGDARGSWSEAWDAHVGFIEPHTLHTSDPVRHQMADERMSHDPVRLTPEMIAVVANVFDSCQKSSDWKIAAASIEATHTHLLLTATHRDVDKTVKWLKDQTTKQIHHSTSHQGPIWCKGKWLEFIFDKNAWHIVRRYIEQHNERRGEGPRPYNFLS
jgi:REP element-mobilizing transposase RayT